MSTQFVSIASVALLMLLSSLSARPSANESGMIGDIRTVISAES